MSYFTAMRRQTGITLGGATSSPAPTVRGIERNETRTAEPPPARGNSGATTSIVSPRNSDHLISEMRVQPPSAAATRAGDEPHSISSSRPTVEMPVGSTTIIREIVLDADKTRSDANSKAEQKPPPLSPSALSLKPSLGKIEDERDTRRYKDGPTMAEVRAWVTEPLQQMADLEALRSVPSRPMPTPESNAREREEPPREAYALEIGSIEIVLDSPPSSSPPPRAQVAARAESSDAPRNRASRHYLRF